MQQTYDAIIIGGGHNGLTCAAYLAKGGEKNGKNKLKVLVLERREKVGGAAMSEEKYPGFTYSTCSYVCSLLRPEIFRFLDLPRHGLQVIPYDINSAPNPEGEGIIYYSDHDRTRESLRRHSIRDAEAYDEYAMEISRYCRFIKRTLLMTPPDPTQINPFVQNRINPWGHMIHGHELTEALSKTPHDVLVKLVGMENHEQTHEQLARLSDGQLRGMINAAELHVRHTGPVAFGGFFYGITGFHGFHVFSGVCINIIMLLMTSNNVFANRGHYLMIEKAGLYWHFVDLVWVFVFLCFYLI